MEKYLYNIELINMNLLKNIRFLNKICYNVNIKHSNTINFVMVDLLIPHLLYFLPASNFRPCLGQIWLGLSDWLSSNQPGFRQQPQLC